MPAPLNPTILPHTLTSLLLSWAAPSDSSECIDRYFITLSNVTEGRGYIYVTANSTTSKIVPDLVPGLEYSFVVTGLCKDLVSRTSSPSNRFTLDGKNQVISNEHTLASLIYNIYDVSCT